jgi:hypothetical protein
MNDHPICDILYTVQEALAWTDLGYAVRTLLPLVVVAVLAWWAFGYRRDWLVRWVDLRWPLILLGFAGIVDLLRVAWYVGCYAP